MGTTAYEFVADFANAVTIHSPHQYDWVARRGRFSIYNLIDELDTTVSLTKAC